MRGGDFEGCVALVTGGTRGIGRALVRQLAGQGAAVSFSFLSNAAAASEIVEQVKSTGGRAMAMRADVRDPRQVEAFVAATAEAFGGVDVLINNAHQPYTSKPFEDCAWDEFQREFDALIQGSFNMVKSTLPHLKRSSYGAAIVNIGSSMTHKALPRHSFYVVAKHALWGLTESLAVELGTYGIRANMVTPGPLETDHNAQLPKEFMAGLAAKTPLGARMGTCEEVASAIMLLCRRDASFVTGANLDVTGGL